MALKVNQNSTAEFELVPEGQYIARCYRVVDLGIQTVTNSFGTRDKPQLFIAFELIGKDDVRMEDGRPFSVSQTFTASLHEKAALYGFLIDWRGKKFTETELEEFDVAKVLGAYATVQIIHNVTGDRTFANIKTIMKFSGKDKPEGVNEALTYDTSAPDKAVFDKLPEFLQKKIVIGEGNIAKAEEARKNLEVLTGDASVEALEPSTTSQINIEDVPF